MFLVFKISDLSSWRISYNTNTCHAWPCHLKCNDLTEIKYSLHGHCSYFVSLIIAIWIYTIGSVIFTPKFKLLSRFTFNYFRFSSELDLFLICLLTTNVLTAFSIKKNHKHYNAAKFAPYEQTNKLETYVCLLSQTCVTCIGDRVSIFVTDFVCLFAMCKLSLARL